MAGGYEINEKDLDKVLHFLQIFHPDIATQDMAIKVAETMHVLAHGASHGKHINFDDAIEEAVRQVTNDT